MVDIHNLKKIFSPMERMGYSDFPQFYIPYVSRNLNVASEMNKPTNEPTIVITLPSDVSFKYTICHDDFAIVQTGYRDINIKYWESEGILEFCGKDKDGKYSSELFLTPFSKIKRPNFWVGGEDNPWLCPSPRQRTPRAINFNVFLSRLNPEFIKVLEHGLNLDSKGVMNIYEEEIKKINSNLIQELDFEKGSDKLNKLLDKFKNVCETLLRGREKIRLYNNLQDDGCIFFFGTEIPIMPLTWLAKDYHKLIGSIYADPKAERDLTKCEDNLWQKYKLPSFSDLKWMDIATVTSTDFAGYGKEWSNKEIGQDLEKKIEEMFSEVYKDLSKQLEEDRRKFKKEVVEVALNGGDDELARAIRRNLDFCEHSDTFDKAIDFIERFFDLGESFDAKRSMDLNPHLYSEDEKKMILQSYQDAIRLRNLVIAFKIISDVQKLEF